MTLAVARTLFVLHCNATRATPHCSERAHAVDGPADTTRKLQVLRHCTGEDWGSESACDAGALRSNARGHALMVTRLAWIAHRLQSSNSLTMKSSMDCTRCGGSCQQLTRQRAMPSARTSCSASSASAVQRYGSSDRLFAISRTCASRGASARPALQQQRRPYPARAVRCARAAPSQRCCRARGARLGAAHQAGEGQLADQ